MKSIKMFVLKSCPYCNKALTWMNELKEENPDFSEIAVTMIDEGIEPNIANQYDYYYVPTYYINDIKVHEGVATKDIIRKIFEKARN